MAIKGTILGDIAGSQYEFDRPKDLDWEHCELFTDKCRYTDDTVMMLAVKSAVDNRRDYGEEMHRIGREYLNAGYGGRFLQWLQSSEPKPYGSYGNGSAMRVSYIGEYFEDLEEVKYEAAKSAEVSHNHPEGIKGAVTTAVCVWMAKHKCSKQEIYDYVAAQYPARQCALVDVPINSGFIRYGRGITGCYDFDIGKDMECLRTHYTWDVSCMNSVPVAMRCFYESDSYISFLRNVFSLECDMDTLCAIGGGVAEEFYGTTGLDDEALIRRYLDDKSLLEIYEHKFYGTTFS